MKIKNNRKGAFTLVEIMIVVAIIGLLAAIAIPNFVKARNTAQANTCIANMKQIDGAIEQWALETKASANAQATTTVLYGANGYIKTEPKCPSGNASYTIPALGTAVVCPNVGSLTNHVLP